MHGLHRDLSPVYLSYPIDRSGKQASDYVILQNISPADRARHSILAGQRDRPDGTQSRPGQMYRPGASRRRRVPNRSDRERPSRRRDETPSEQGNDGQTDRKVPHTQGAGVKDRPKQGSNRPPKQYTRVWYCHMNCSNPGPWRWDTERCVGCEHDRCGRCPEEVIETRDPSPPSRC